ncbi:MAG: hypothetical protein K2O00_04090 [Muribaculaceae bacterium]|nr:hypothetical protein [Muribaculaceae bacterium]
MTTLPKKKITLIFGIIIAVIIIVAVSLIAFQGRKLSAVATENEQLKLTNEQLQLANEFQSVNNEFAQYENQTQVMVNDSLTERYAAAKAKVEKLLAELNSEKKKSAKRIKELQDEIATLKGILRHYIAKVDSLSKENQGLRVENEEIKDKNRRLTERVESVSKDNEKLNERMTLAEKLNVTGINLVALKGNGKVEKNITKAKQLKVTFTIPQNNSTPAGEKTIYLRITNPEGDLLGNGGIFHFEGTNVQCTARTTIEYANEEIGGVTIFYDVNTTLNPGEYTVELFADNYRLAARKFTMKK